MKVTTTPRFIERKSKIPTEEGKQTPLHFYLLCLWSSLGDIGIIFGNGDIDRDSFHQYGE